MKFLIDANITRRAAETLKSVYLKHSFISVESKFGQGVSDIDWLTKVSVWTSKPIVLSGDVQILLNPHERSALNQSGVSFVVMTGGWLNLAWPEQAWRLIRVWPEVMGAVSESPPPEVFELRLKPLRIRKMSTN